MLYVELEKIPIQLTVHCRIICFWARIVLGKQAKLSALLTQHDYRICPPPIYIAYTK